MLFWFSLSLKGSATHITDPTIRLELVNLFYNPVSFVIYFWRLVTDHGVVTVELSVGYRWLYLCCFWKTAILSFSSSAPVKCRGTVRHNVSICICLGLQGLALSWSRWSGLFRGPALTVVLERFRQLTIIMMTKVNDESLIVKQLETRNRPTGQWARGLKQGKKEGLKEERKERKQ